MDLSNSHLLHLQHHYITTGNQDTLTTIYNHVVELSKRLIKNIGSKYNYHLPDYQIDEITHDTATEIVEKYLTKSLVIQTNYSGYIYKIIFHQVFPNSKEVINDIADYADELESGENVEEAIVNEVYEEQLTDTIVDIAMLYLQDYPQEKQIEMLDYLKDVIGRGKSVYSYLYKIPTKKDREIFSDIITEIKVYLESV